VRRASWVGVTVAAFILALIALTASPTSAATYVVAASGTILRTVPIDEIRSS